MFTDDDFSQFLGVDPIDDIPFDDVPPYTGTEWWRGGDPSPPPNAQFADGAVVPNTPYGTSVADDPNVSGADASAIAGDPYNPSGTNYRPYGGRAPYGVSYTDIPNIGTEAIGALGQAISSDDPYAIGQNLGLMGDYMDDSLSSWDAGTNVAW